MPITVGGQSQAQTGNHIVTTGHGPADCVCTKVLSAPTCILWPGGGGQRLLSKGLTGLAGREFNLEWANTPNKDILYLCW